MAVHRLHKVSFPQTDQKSQPQSGPHQQDISTYLDKSLIAAREKYEPRAQLFSEP